MHKTTVSGRHCGMPRAWNLILDAMHMEILQLWKHTHTHHVYMHVYINIIHAYIC